MYWKKNIREQNLNFEVKLKTLNEVYTVQVLLSKYDNSEQTCEEIVNQNARNKLKMGFAYFRVFFTIRKTNRSILSALRKKF